MIEGTGIAEQNRPFQGTVIAEHSQQRFIIFQLFIHTLSFV